MLILAGCSTSPEPEVIEVPVDRPVLILPPSELIRPCTFSPDNNTIGDALEALKKENDCHKADKAGIRQWKRQILEIDTEGTV